MIGTMIFRRRTSLEKREEEWLRQQDASCNWDTSSSLSHLEIDDSFREEKKEDVSPKDAEEPKQQLTTGRRPPLPKRRPPPPPPLRREGSDKEKGDESIEKEAPRRTRPPPPPPPPLEREASDKDKADVSIETRAPRRRGPPPPPPPLRREDRDKEKADESIETQAPRRRGRPPPPPPPREDLVAAATKSQGTPQQRKHRRPSGAKVSVLVDNWEKLAARAEEDAARNEAILRERDKTKVRAYFEARRAAAREARSVSNNIAPPTFANVAANRSELVVEISAATQTIEWCLVGEREEWTVENKVPVCVTLGPGRYVLLARAIDAGSKLKSQVSSAVFWLEPPPKTLENHRLHPLHTLHYLPFHREEVEQNQSRLRKICANCCKDLTVGNNNKLRKGGRFVCIDCGISGKQQFEICYECALRNVPCSKQKPHVDLDSGAKRLWLSEPVAFEGNLTVIKPQSYPMLSLLAETIRRNPGLCLRLEGHTNSDCGLECHGLKHCVNNTCLQLFGEGKGGAIGFSKARAAAVRDWLLTEGRLDPDDISQRIVAVGLGGSRRLAQDTEGPDNHLNRRVEAHIIDFVDEDALSQSS